MTFHRTGVLQYEEFGRALSRVGIKLAKEDFDVLISDLDKNGDGYIEYGTCSHTSRSRVQVETSSETKTALMYADLRKAI